MYQSENKFLPLYVLNFCTQQLACCLKLKERIQYKGYLLNNMCLEETLPTFLMHAPVIICWRIQLKCW